MCVWGGGVSVCGGVCECDGISLSVIGPLQAILQPAMDGGGGGSRTRRRRRCTRKLGRRRGRGRGGGGGGGGGGRERERRGMERGRR